MRNRVFYTPLRCRIKRRYELSLGCKPNLRVPHKFSEKAQWRKIYCPQIKEISAVVSKDTVYDYVARTLPEEHLLPIKKVFYDQITAADIEALGDNIVLQPSHRSGQVFFINKQSETDAQKIANLLNIMTKWRYDLASDEPWYGFCKPSVIVRPTVRNSDGSEFLNDCKIHTFIQPDGSAKFICEIINTYPHWRILYDENFQRLPFEWSPDLYPPPDFEIAKPVGFEKMLEYAHELARPFGYVRVDFMLGAKEFYFTELTFAPAGGVPRMSPRDWDDKVGELWHLEIGNPFKRLLWKWRTWLPLWKTSFPVRVFRGLHRYKGEWMIQGVKPSDYQRAIKKD